LRVLACRQWTGEAVEYGEDRRQARDDSDGIREGRKKLEVSEGRSRRKARGRKSGGDDGGLGLVIV